MAGRKSRMGRKYFNEKDRADDTGEEVISM